MSMSFDYKLEAMADSSTNITAKERDDKTDDIHSRFNIGLTRSWILSVIPVTGAVCVILYAISAGGPVISIQSDLDGRLGEMLTRAKLDSASGITAIEDIREEEGLCDVITSSVTALFSQLFLVLSRDVVTTINNYTSTLTEVFVLPGPFEMKSLKVLFVIFPALGTLLYFTALIVSCLPCIHIRRRAWCLQQVRSWLLLSVCMSVSSSLFLIQTIQSLVNIVPLTDFTVQVGPVVHLTTLATFLMFSSYIQVWIGESVPMK